MYYYFYILLVAPKITARPSDITVQSGNTISFKCEATGDPKPIVTWKRNDIQVSEHIFYMNNIHQSWVCLPSLKKRLGPTLTCRFLEYAGN